MFANKLIPIPLRASHHPTGTPATEQEHRFNSVRTRATVEPCFRLLKGRWMRLGPAGGSTDALSRKSLQLNCHVQCCTIFLWLLKPFDAPAQPKERMPREPCPAQSPLEAIRRRQELMNCLTSGLYLKVLH